jgi:tight adherence protein B
VLKEKAVRIRFIKDKERNVQKCYNEYNYDVFEWLLYAGIGSLALAMTAWIFYKNATVVFLAFLLGLFYPLIKKKSLIEKQRNVLRLQFKDMLYYLGASLSAGKSVEQAFITVHSTLKNLYPGKKSDIVMESDLIINRLRMNENIEDILNEFADRAGVEEINYFSDVFSVCKRTGGNLIEVVRTTSRMISEHIETKQEIATAFAAKKQEQRLLSLSPLAMIIFISYMSGDFMEPLFTTPEGRIIMTISLILIGLGGLISNRIMNIKF